MGIAEVLTVLFTYLKLTHKIDWSWWAVTSPEWISLIFILVIVFGIVGAAVKSVK